jgi:hypothetical protein
VPGPGPFYRRDEPARTRRTGRGTAPCARGHLRIHRLDRQLTPGADKIETLV